MKIKLFGNPLNPRAHGTFPSGTFPTRCTDRELRTTKWQPSYPIFTFQVNRQKNTFRKTMVWWWRNHHRKDGNNLLHRFWSQNQLVPCLRSTSRLSGGDLSSYKSGQRTKGWPPHGQSRKNPENPETQKTMFLLTVDLERKIGITGVPFGRTEVSIPFVWSFFSISIAQARSCRP